QTLYLERSGGRPRVVHAAAVEGQRRVDGGQVDGCPRHNVLQNLLAAVWKQGHRGDLERLHGTRRGGQAAGRLAARTHPRGVVVKRRGAVGSANRVDVDSERLLGRRGDAHPLKDGSRKRQGTANPHGVDRLNLRNAGVDGRAELVPVLVVEIRTA